MQIVIYGINFYPEKIGIGKYSTELAVYLSSLGHSVTMVTGYPYYPSWQLFGPYKNRGYYKEQIEGVTVYRCPLWIPKKPSGLRRILHLLSFAISSALCLLWVAFQQKPDLTLTVVPTMFCTPAALLTKILGRGKAVLHLQDFELDSALNLGLLNANPLMGRWLDRLERSLLGQFDHVTTISERMLQKLIQVKGLSPRRVSLFPNWIDTTLVCPQAVPADLKAEWGIPDNVCVALYSGNLGRKQGLEIIIEAAQQLQDQTPVHFVICGSGPSRRWLAQRATGLTNISFLDLQPADRFTQLLCVANIHLLPQRASVADLVMPSKLLAMFASGRPVITTALPGTQLAGVVTGCGIVTTPGDAQAFSQAIAYLATHPEERDMYGKAARTYAEVHFHKNVILADAAKLFESLVYERYQPREQIPYSLQK